MKGTNGLLRKITAPFFFNLSNFFLSSFYFLFLSPFYLFTLGLLFFFSPDLLASFFLFYPLKMPTLELNMPLPFYKAKWCESMLLARWCSMGAQDGSRQQGCSFGVKIDWCRGMVLACWLGFVWLLMHDVHASWWEGELGMAGRTWVIWHKKNGC